MPPAVLVVILALVACGGHAAAPEPTTPIGAATPAAPYVPPPVRTCGGPMPAAGPTTIRDLDFCNMTYAGPLSDEPIDVYGGEHEVHVYINLPACDHRHTTDLWRVGDVAYGDLDGDGAEDAAVTLDHYWFGCADDDLRTTEVRAFAVRDHEIVPLGADTINMVDDRTLDAGTELAITGGVVIRTLHYRGMPACTDHFRIDAGAGDLEQLGPPCT